MIKKLPIVEKQRLLTSLIKENLVKPEGDAIMTHFASEKALSRDWLSQKEDEAWKDL